MQERFSMKEYKPLTISDRLIRIEDEINEINAERIPYVTRKQEIEFELANLKAKVRQSKYLHGAEYDEVLSSQRSLAKEKNKIEKSFSEFRQKLSELHTEKERLKLRVKASPESIAKTTLTELRGKYMEFSSDRSRVSSMRAMASKFVEEITGILTEISKSEK